MKSSSAPDRCCFGLELAAWRDEGPLQVDFMRRLRRLNPYRPATDTGLLKIFALVAVVILIVISGAFDCRFQFIYVGFC